MKPDAPTGLEEEEDDDDDTSTERHIGNGPKTPSATEKGSVSPPLSLM